MTFHHDFLNVLILPQAEAGYDHDSGAFVLFYSGRLLKTRQNITVFLVRTRRAIVMADSLAGIVFSTALTAILGAQPSYLYFIMKTYITYRTVNTPNPLANTMSNHFLYYPTPSNLNYN